MCRLSWNLGASASWNPQGLSRPVMGLLYLYLFTEYRIFTQCLPPNTPLLCPHIITQCLPPNTPLLCPHIITAVLKIRSRGKLKTCNHFFQMSTTKFNVMNLPPFYNYFATCYMKGPYSPYFIWQLASLLTRTISHNGKQGGAPRYYPCCGAGTHASYTKVLRLICDYTLEMVSFGLVDMRHI